MKRVLCLLAEGFEEIETVTPIDLLRRAGVEVVIAALNPPAQGPLLVTGRSGLTLLAEAPLDRTDVEGFDMLFLPGGPAVKKLREDGRPAALAQAFCQAGKLVAAICAAPLVLHDAGLLNGKKYTAHDSTYGELTAALAQEKVVVDGLITTSRGAGTALPFGLQLVAALAGADKAAEVARSIME